MHLEAAAGLRIGDMHEVARVLLCWLSFAVELLLVFVLAYACFLFFYCSFCAAFVAACFRRRRAHLECLVCRLGSAFGSCVVVSAFAQLMVAACIVVVFGLL